MRFIDLIFSIKISGRFRNFMRAGCRCAGGSARYFDPQTGRFWTQDDPDYGDREYPQSLHLYGYCESDPVNNTDPRRHGIGQMLTIMDNRHPEPLVHN
jgi:RHS repeat-associated protein